MIQKDWRNRLRLLKKDKVFQTIVISGIVVPSLLGGIITGDFPYAFTFFGTIIGTGALMICIYDVFFAKESAMGMEKNKKKQEKKDKQNYQEINSNKMWEKNKENMWSAARDTVLYYDIIELNIAISYILKNASLSLKEKKYFAQEFPSEMIEIVTMYRELQGEHRERIKTLIQRGIEQKKKEWEQLYIEPIQNKLEEACVKKVEQTFQEQKEHIYISE